MKMAMENNTVANEESNIINELEYDFFDNNMSINRSKTRSISRTSDTRGSVTPAITISNISSVGNRSVIRGRPRKDSTGSDNASSTQANIDSNETDVVKRGRPTK